MTLAELKTALESTGLPVAYRSWAVGHVPAMPYIVYLFAHSDNFAADNKVYSQSLSIDIELYSETKDLTSETLIEQTLDGVPVYWEKEETYIDSEDCYEVVYTVTI